MEALTEALTNYKPEPIALGGMSAQAVIARTQRVQEVMRAVMKEGVHYGIVPGTPKKSLWQPGAEVLYLTFELRPELEVEDLSDDDTVRYRVVARVIHIPTGAVVGAGVGECSSGEEKYRWRKAVCSEEWEEAATDRRRKKWKRGKTDAYQEQQVRTEPRDMANTVLKMAAKRARVDGAKSTCGASDIFDQDLEDLASAGIDLESAEKRGVRMPQAKGAADGATANAASAGSPHKNGGGSASLPEEAIAEIKGRLHTRGVISHKQQSRLFAIAGKNGWTPKQVAQVCKDALGIEEREMQTEDNKTVTVLQIPAGEPYEKLVAAFEGFKP